MPKCVAAAASTKYGWKLNTLYTLPEKNEVMRSFLSLSSGRRRSTETARPPSQFPIPLSWARREFRPRARLELTERNCPRFLNWEAWAARPKDSCCVRTCILSPIHLTLRVYLRASPGTASCDDRAKDRATRYCWRSIGAENSRQTISNCLLLLAPALSSANIFRGQ